MPLGLSFHQQLLHSQKECRAEDPLLLFYTFEEIYRDLHMFFSLRERLCGMIKRYSRKETTSFHKTFPLFDVTPISY